MRDSGKRKIRDLTASRVAGFVKIWERDTVSGRKTVLGMEMTEVRDYREKGAKMPDQDPSPRLCLYGLSPGGYLG